MTAFGELAFTGEIGPVTFELLRRLCRQYTRRHSFPPVGGHRTWTDDAVDDLRGELLAEKGPVLVLNCYLRATDDPSLERLLLAAIGNYLKDEAKKTERGKLRRRLGTLLEQDPRFLRVRASSAGTAGWALTGGPDAPTAVGFEVVQRAAVSVRGVAITRLNPAGPTPRAAREALLAVAHAVLTAARGTVTDELLARAVESRFALLPQPSFVELALDGAHDPAAAHEGEPQAQVGVDATARELWCAMTGTERAMFPHLGDPDADLSVIAGTGPEQARAQADALAEKVRFATVDDDQYRVVALALLQLCEVRT